MRDHKLLGEYYDASIGKHGGWLRRYWALIAAGITAASAVIGWAREFLTPAQAIFALIAFPVSWTLIWWSGFDAYKAKAKELADLRESLKIAPPKLAGTFKVATKADSFILEFWNTGDLPIEWCQCEVYADSERQPFLRGRNGGEPYRLTPGHSWEWPVAFIPGGKEGFGQVQFSRNEKPRSQIVLHAEAHATDRFFHRQSFELTADGRTPVAREI